MEYQPYLTFELSHTCYGLAAATVQELLLLPEIMAVPDSPSAIAGVIDLRGDIVPVLDLHRRLGRKSPPYQLSDCVIIIQTTTDRLGIIVNQVREVQPIGTDQISTQVMQSQPPGASLISGMARVGEEIVTLLNGEQLLHPLTPLSDLQSNGHQPTFQPDSPTAPPEVQAAIGSPKGGTPSQGRL
ncbi:hypothetical protein BST81_17255 [Leptolyngbya sp. 'hensonii']|uniref:chemotaxis protein CheW n=1 Tax=Leptolyngbya sp. 'hensonii' TaxID=1922337 RepID=UPI00094F8775|nr:chemotaxis protein CheW [Leptolyngbya sp. 'hensonii']OLP17103.1 hypothetical protein BST81_17255 [Leptolyngbya sp. 'hensonii']